MTRMTRTQITLEQHEYLFLKARATEQGISLSAVIRALVRTAMEQARTGAPHVRELAGLIAESDFSGKDHDRILYGADTTPAVSPRTPGPSDASEKTSAG